MNEKMKSAYLICVDSDGCAVDSMTIKHEKAFGPAFIEIFQMQDFEKEILKEWNRTNLYSLERGINRFKGLAEIIAYTDENFKKIEGADIFKEYVSAAKELNVTVFEEYYLNSGKAIFKKAVDYSNRVNQLIETISENEITTFEYVEDVLKRARQFAKIVVVSSANKSAVEEEWHRLAINQYVDSIYTQEDGTKSQIIARLKKEGKYSEDYILKIGDSMGDFHAAKANNVAFYPILVNKEGLSWKELLETYLQVFKLGNLKKNQQQLNHKFLENLTSERG